MRLAALLILLALPLAAQVTEDAAQTPAEKLESAQARLTAAETTRDRVAALTATVQAYEAGLAALRDSLRQATAQEAVVADDLARNRAQTATLLGALQAISRTPLPVQMTHPNGPRDAVRAGMIVADLTPALQAQAAILAAQVAELNRLRGLQQDAIAMLTDGLRGAQTARADLGQAIAQRTDLPRRFEEDPVQTALLLASTDTLAAFADRLAAVAPNVQAAMTPTGDLPLPVAGAVTVLEDQPGVMVRAAPRALVTAPVAATILFRGPLLDHGTVIILEPAADVLFVLSGLAEAFGEPGEIVDAGAPLGLLGGEQVGVDGILNQADTVDPSQPLYIEVRDGQSPIDPGVWFAINKE
ncbi:hypothetical protein [Yoonia sp.]|uniref:murein hydrolase activator EnvC family protein n=1 Tax=Yoonia sp. TaxID=2212373 RepID=UPI0019FD528E|nr:hypothetical protein [Yoonia sp.]MBE0412284.1 hypothetical protein [Yoonia sp.]